MWTYESRRLAAMLLILALAACGGGDGDEEGDDTPSFQVSGRVTDGAGAPVANVEIRIEIHRDCFGGMYGPPIAYNWFGSGTSNASGEYVAIVRLHKLSDCTLNAFFRIQALSFSCGGNKQLPCYRGNFETWQQDDLAPKSSLNFVVAQKSRIFGTIQFPNGLKQFPNGTTARVTSLDPFITPDPTGGQGGKVDQDGRFSFGPLDPGSYTVDFPPHRCSEIGYSGCNGLYDFTPPSITVDIVAPNDIDISFSAVPK
jgi:hypothetical protein